MPRAISVLLNDFNIQYEGAYCYIKKDNSSSIRVAEKCGAQMIGQVEMRGFMRRLYSVDKGRFYVYRFKKYDD